MRPRRRRIRWTARVRARDSGRDRQRVGPQSLDPAEPRAPTSGREARSHAARVGRHARRACSSRPTRRRRHRRVIAELRRALPEVCAADDSAHRRRRRLERRDGRDRARAGARRRRPRAEPREGRGARHGARDGARARVRRRGHRGRRRPAPGRLRAARCSTRRDDPRALVLGVRDLARDGAPRAEPLLERHLQLLPLALHAASRSPTRSAASAAIRSRDARARHARARGTRSRPRSSSGRSPRGCRSSRSRSRSSIRPRTSASRTSTRARSRAHRRGRRADAYELSRRGSNQGEASARTARRRMERGRSGSRPWW